MRFIRQQIRLAGRLAPSARTTIFPLTGSLASRQEFFLRRNYGLALMVTSRNEQLAPSPQHRIEWALHGGHGVSISAPSSGRPNLNKARILLADDHPTFPELEERLLAAEFDVVGKVANGQELFDQAMRLKPDVIVTDISMPVLNGIAAADRLKESGCNSRIIFLTIHSDADFVRRCLAIGAFGYVVKPRIALELIPAIREALAGRIFVSQHLAVENST